MGSEDSYVVRKHAEIEVVQLKAAHLTGSVREWRLYCDHTVLGSWTIVKKRATWNYMDIWIAHM